MLILVLYVHAKFPKQRMLLWCLTSTCVRSTNTTMLGLLKWWLASSSFHVPSNTVFTWWRTAVANWCKVCSSTRSASFAHAMKVIFRQAATSWGRFTCFFVCHLESRHAIEACNIIYSAMWDLMHAPVSRQNLSLTSRIEIPLPFRQHSTELYWYSSILCIPPSMDPLSVLRFLQPTTSHHGFMATSLGTGPSEATCAASMAVHLSFAMATSSHTRDRCQERPRALNLTLSQQSSTKSVFISVANDARICPEIQWIGMQCKPCKCNLGNPDTIQSPFGQ